MNEEEQFFWDRSDLIGKLIDYIKLCNDVERCVTEELEEILYEAAEESGQKLDISIQEE